MKTFNLNFSERQQKAFEILQDKDTNCLLYGGAKGGGKSYLGCYWIFIKCCQLIDRFKIPQRKYPMTVAFMGRKRSVDFSDTTLETWKRCIPEQAYTLRTAEKEIIVNDRVKVAYGGFDSEADIKKFNSAEFANYFIDQAEEVSQDDIALLRGTLRLKINDTDLDYTGLLTANPAECWLKDSFINNPRTGYKYLPALPTDNPYLPPSYVPNLLEAFAHRPELIEAYVKGNWDIMSGANLVIKPQWVQKAVNKKLYNHLGKVVISCDPARYGDDETVIYVIKDGEIIGQKIYGQKSTMETAGNCVSMARNYKAELILVDSIGVGGGVVDRLMELGQSVKEVNFASKPSNEIKQEKYYNLRSEVYWEAAQMFCDDLVSIPDEQGLIKQLSHIMYTDASRGRIKIESKADIKKRLEGSSPDRADALVIGLWGLQWVGEFYNDYERISGEALNSGRYSRLSPLYQEMVETLAGSGKQKSDYDIF